MMIETLLRFLPLIHLFRYEKISNLIEKLERTFESQGYDKSLFFHPMLGFLMLHAITGIFGCLITFYFRSKKVSFV